MAKRTSPYAPGSRIAPLTAGPTSVGVISPAAKTISTTGYVPIVQVRLGVSTARVVVDTLSVTPVGSTTTFAWALLLNPTLGAGAAAVWAQEGDTPIEVDYTAAGEVSAYQRRIRCSGGAGLSLVQLDVTDYPTGLADGDVLALCGIGIGGDVDFIGSIDLVPYKDA